MFLNFPVLDLFLQSLQELFMVISEARLCFKPVLFILIDRDEVKRHCFRLLEPLERDEPVLVHAHELVALGRPDAGLILIRHKDVPRHLGVSLLGLRGSRISAPTTRNFRNGSLDPVWRPGTKNKPPTFVLPIARLFFTINKIK